MQVYVYFLSRRQQHPCSVVVWITERLYLGLSFGIIVSNRLFHIYLFCINADVVRVRMWLETMTDISWPSGRTLAPYGDVDQHA